MKIITFILTLFAPIYIFAQDIPQSIKENAKMMDALRRNNSVIQLQIINSSGEQVTGSAFVTDVFDTKKGLVVNGLTAGHVVNASVRSFVVLNGKDDDKKAMISVNPSSFQIHKKFNPKEFNQYDVARFSFVLTSKEQAELIKAQFVIPVALEVAKDPLKKEGVPVIVAGYPLGASPLVGVSSAGRLRSNEMISVICASDDISPLIPGMSGGPLLDSQKRVIGINSYTDKKIGFCVPVHSSSVKEIVERKK